MKKGANMINCIDDRKYELQVLDVLATCCLDPFWERIEWRDIPQIKLQAQVNHISLFLKPIHDRSPPIQVQLEDKSESRSRHGSENESGEWRI